MMVYHLGRSKYATQLTGEGAKLHGGRWNVIGQPCIYTSAARSLCVLEYAANVYLDEIAQDLSFTAYEIPEDGWASFQLKELPAGWMEISSSMFVKEWGTKQLQKYLALKLPSVILPSEFNFLLNPLHPDFKKVHIKEVETFTFDSRIKK
ncbi:RES family NAD+ phosphorylase [Flavisolibacter ginsenosidimutans]|uniref:RES domain-containing protein n=1 Tax=Flavisolibacter ginsenosidimutans TaxID=661481 RepID=A0A5B8UEI1_9BACT|nr:RES family NAD+ phosphorylase [Flavisolibacter ginsenosidimutans]QEC54974.1 RES domain-containing protein [Flavisolibacter ginsenosidimutans]